MKCMLPRNYVPSMLSPSVALFAVFIQSRTRMRSQDVKLSSWTELMSIPWSESVTWKFSANRCRLFFLLMKQHIMMIQSDTEITVAKDRGTRIAVISLVSFIHICLWAPFVTLKWVEQRITQASLDEVRIDEKPRDSALLWIIITHRIPSYILFVI